MASFEDQANALLETLKRATLDMEADLGKASRTDTHWPDLGGVMLLVEPSTLPHDLESARERLKLSFLDGHHRNAQQGRQYLDDLLHAQRPWRDFSAVPLTPDEQNVIDQIKTLAEQMKLVTDHESAKALAASIN